MKGVAVCVNSSWLSPTCRSQKIYMCEFACHMSMGSPPATVRAAFRQAAYEHSYSSPEAASLFFLSASFCRCLLYLASCNLLLFFLATYHHPSGDLGDDTSHWCLHSKDIELNSKPTNYSVQYVHTLPAHPVTSTPFASNFFNAMSPIMLPSAPLPRSRASATCA